VKDITSTLCASGLHEAWPPGSPTCHRASLLIDAADLQALAGDSAIPLEALCASGIRSLSREEASAFTGYDVGRAGFVIPTPIVTVTGGNIRASLETWPPTHWRFRFRRYRDGRDVNGPKYLSPRGASPRLYPPPLAPFTEDSTPDEIAIVEGERKALSATAAGWPMLAVSGVYNWKRSGPDDVGTVLPELRAIADGRKFLLLYDSDIDESHKAYAAFHRLGRTLLALGAKSARVWTLPSDLSQKAAA